MTVEPNPAASLLVLRHPERQVLMGMRGAGHKFMPNRLVFPGGRVDEADFAASSASDLRPDVHARLARTGGDDLARALAIAAARELEEETGLTLGAPPALAGMDFLCRAITPDNQPIRFDARFLVVDAAEVGGTLAGSGELEDLRWFGLDEALALDIAFATRNVLQQLLDWLSGARHTGVPTLRNRTWSIE